MNEKFRAGIALIAFLALVASLQLAVGYAFYSALEPDDRQGFAVLLAGQRELLLELGALELGLFGIAFVLAYQVYVNGSLKIAEGVRIILSANPGHRLELAGPVELRQAAHAINALADHSEMLIRDREARIAEAKCSVEAEKNRLAALMSELSQGVLVCTLDGRILLYNERARQVICASTRLHSGCAAPLVGLGRSIFAFVDQNLLAHALESIQARLEKNEADLNAQFLITTRSGQFVRVHLAPVLTAAATASPHPDPPITSGFVMTVEDITRSFELDTTRDMLLHAFTEGSRASLASIRAAVEMLAYYPDCAPVDRHRFIQVINEEVGNLSGKLHQLTTDHVDSLKTRWPLEEMPGADLIEAVRHRIETRLGVAVASADLDLSIWVKVDSYAMIQALSYLASRLKEEWGIGELRIDLSRHARIVQLDLIWPGPELSQEILHQWEQDSLHTGGEDNPLTLYDVLERHGAEIVYIMDKERNHPLFRLLLPLTAPLRPLPGASIRYDESRPEFYDFDLFHRACPTPELDQAALTDLSYTVFDTETTGLDPSAGDEIISIGAARIVNNRLLHYETYEQMIDPKRPITGPAQLIHGISNEMLRGQPSIDEVLPQFHEYCADPVLVGHNAAFDLRFLQLKEASAGVRFTQPVLDTLLLSQVLHPRQESHALEAIAERLGVAVVARHTALGDALVTGEVFLRMIPLLAAHGIRTLGQAREATEKIFAGEY